MGYPPTEPAAVTGKLLPGDPRRPTSVRALDRYTVEVKVPAASQAIMLLEIGDNLYTNPPECWTEGDGWQDWTEVVGSGPWILADYITAASITYERNPDYFEYDPLHPENRLPYLDTLKLRIIPDRSSLLAAFRTGQVDLMWGFGGASYDEAAELKEQCPDALWSRRLGTGGIAAGRMDKTELPFCKLEVRQAMNMAVDKESFLKDYLNGEGVMLGYPYLPTKGYEKFYTPLEEMPEEVQMLFTYDPPRAKELLEEAGYPDGFSTTIYCSAADADQVSMLQSYLAAVNIDMEIKTLEFGAWFGMWAARSYEEMFFGPLTGLWAPFEQLTTKKGMYSNNAYIDDPYYVEVGEVIGRDMVKNPDNYFKTMKEEGVYELASAWGIFMPSRYSYNMWWPWMQNYYGVSWAGWANTDDLYKYFWVDSTLKRSMGY
jgi:peptide/nickel transport system substrate-binding protein